MTSTNRKKKKKEWISWYWRMRRTADVRYSQHLVIYCQISGRVMDLRFSWVEAELLTPRTAAGLPVCPLPSLLWCHPEACVALQPAGAVDLSGWKLIRVFGMGFFVVNKITWLIQQTCGHASTNTRELVEMVSVRKAGVLTVQCLLLWHWWGKCTWIPRAVSAHLHYQLERTEAPQQWRHWRGWPLWVHLLCKFTSTGLIQFCPLHPHHEFGIVVNLLF